MLGQPLLVSPPQRLGTETNVVGTRRKPRENGEEYRSLPATAEGEKKDALRGFRLIPGVLNAIHKRPRSVSALDDQRQEELPAPVDERVLELKAIASAEASSKPKQTRLWYIVDSLWIMEWLGYALNEPPGCSRPPPLDNTVRLCQQSISNGAWTPRRDLRIACASSLGDYRRISPAVWDVLSRLNPGSGPQISVEGEPYDDVGRWVVRIGNWQPQSRIERPLSCSNRASGAVVQGAERVRGKRRSGSWAGDGYVTLDGSEEIIREKDSEEIKQVQQELVTMV